MLRLSITPARATWRALIGSLALSAPLLSACSGDDGSYPSVGEVQIFDERARALIPDDAVIEKLTGNQFRWSEGPLWIADGDGPGMLLFSDVPENTIYSWSEEKGVETFLSPSGLEEPDGENIFREPGSNGLARAADGGVLIGDHGWRAVSHLDLETRTKSVVVDRYEGDRFNSPNDVAISNSGAIYFTDPPYGLRDLDDSSVKELDFNGVYRLTPGNGDARNRLEVLDNTLTRPNGVALSPDEDVLYVAVSDPEAAVLYRYVLDGDGRVQERTALFDATTLVGPNAPGLPDGMAIDVNGNIFATGPGGVHVLSPEGDRLALISTGTAAANCAFGDDGSTLYITSGPFLARIALNTRGVGF